jgi:hypothetical protein
MTRQEAIEMAESGWWKDKSACEIVEFQLFEDRLCMDFGAFHSAVEQVLGRTGWTHEFAFADGLRQEYLKTRPAPTMQEITELIPEEKRIVIVKT